MGRRSEDVYLVDVSSTAGLSRRRRSTMPVVVQPTVRPQRVRVVARELPAPRPRRVTLGLAFANRANNLAALRLLLAVGVVYSHCYPLASADAHGDLLFTLTSAVFSGGHGLTVGFLAVCLFFVLSGFLISHSFARAADVRSFFVKRACRIYPAFILAALFCLLVVAPLGLVRALSPSDLARFVIDVATLREYHLPGLFGDNPFPNALNGSIWSIKYEVACYGLVAIIGTLGGLRRPRLIAALLAVAASIYALQASGTLDALGVTLWWPRPVRWVLSDIENWPRVLTSYLAGVALYVHRHRISASGGLALAAVATFIAGGMISPTLMVVALPFLVGYAALCVGLSTRGRQFTARLDKCDLSYGIYLFAFPVQQLLVDQLPSLRGQPLLLMCVTLPIVIALAMISSRFVERRFARK